MEYCISDIHGYYDLFCRLLDKIRFGGGDRLYVMGDIIDKGPDSVRLAKLLFSLPEAVCIAGNHEYDFLTYYRALMRETEDYDRVLEELRAYFPDGRLLDWETVDAFEALPLYAETDTFIGVHAGLPVRDGKLLPPAAADPRALVYDRTFKEPGVCPENGKCVLFGHTPVRYLTGKDEILLYPRPGRTVKTLADCVKVHLDTGTYHSGVLGCIAADTCRCLLYTSPSPRD